jgi:hypothetical protein
MTPQQLFRAAAREAEAKCPQAARVLNRIGVDQELVIQRALVEQFVLLLRDFGQDLDPHGKHPTIGEQIERQNHMRDITPQTTVVLCERCGVYPADLPSKLCPCCEAYSEHQA